MASYWSIVNNVIGSSDVLLMILDARFTRDTRNNEIEDKVKASKKPLIYVINKSDLVSEDELEKIRMKIRPCVVMSSKMFRGINRLRERIIIEAHHANLETTDIIVGVLGYPNVGKSSMINALKGRKSAKTSAMSGYTKGVQKIRVDKRITFLDTPGVIPYKESDSIKHSMIGTIDFTKTKDPDVVVIELMQKFPGVIEKHHSVKVNEDFEAVLEEIAMKKGILKKGGVPDILRISRTILTEWQRGDMSFE